MIVAKKAIKDFIKNQPSIVGFADELKVSRETVYNILNEENVSSEMIGVLLSKTGFEFEKAFEIKE
jgi:plasmid maintenance system antidote protein VapI